MESVDDIYKVYVENPCKKFLEVLDKYDKDYEGLTSKRPKNIEDFLEFYRQKELSIAQAGDNEKEKKKAIKKHFGLTPNFFLDINKQIEEVQKVIDRIKQEKFEISIDIIPALIMKEQNDKEIQFREGIEAEYDAIVSQVEALRTNIQNDNVKKNRDYELSVKADNEVFVELQNKKEILLKYSDKITDNCALWGISPLDIDIDSDTFSLEELNVLYDKYIAAMDKEESGENIIKLLKSKVPDPKMQAAIIGIAFILCFTPLLNVLSLVFFGGIAAGQIRNKNKAKYYSVLGAITFKIDPMSMSTSNLDKSKLLPEIITDEMLDTDPRFQKFNDLIEDVMEREEFTGASVYQNALNGFSMKKDNFLSEVKRFERIWNDKRDAIVSDLHQEIEFLKDAAKKGLNDYEKFGDRFSKSLVFDSNFTLGCRDDIDEQFVDVGLNNVIIKPSMNDRVHNAFLRLLYVNVITHVNPTNLVVHIYDPNNRGSLFMPFYNGDLKDIIKFEHTDLGKLIEELRTIADENLKNLAGYTIHEYNKKADEEGLTPKKYHLLFVLSQPKNVEEDEALRSFFDYSTNVGIMIYLVSNNMQSNQAITFRRPFQGVDDPIYDYDDQKCREFALKHVEAYKDLAPKGGILWNDFISNVFTPEEFWTGNGSEFIDIYPGYIDGDPTVHPGFPFGNEGDIHMIGVGGTGAGKSVFINHCIATATWLYSPKELELWLADFKGVEFSFYLGNEKFPAILPHISACLCTADPDFATSLFKAFRDKADFRYVEMMAAGVKNMPGWNGLVVQNCKHTELTGEEIRKPSKLIDLHKKDKHPYSPTWTEEDYWPRVWFIVDEFQVIFEKADPKNLESINADITQISKVARAAGAHIFFTSQSMKKTVSADILNQFSLRFGLRCAEDVSQEIMGSKLSSSITAKNGWLYIKTVSLKPEDAKFCRTPFIQNDIDKQFRSLTLESAGVDYTKDDYLEGCKKLHGSVLHEHIARTCVEAKKRGMLHKNPPVTYNEKDECKFSFLEDVYKNEAIIAKLPKYGVFFMGDRMAYSENQAPENVILTAKNNSHIFAVFNDDNDIPMFFKTIVYNIKHNKIEQEIINERTAQFKAMLEEAESPEETHAILKKLENVQGQTILYHAANMDMGYICEVDKYLDDRTKQFYSEKSTYKDVFDWVNNVMESRKEHPEQKERPLWVICIGWDKLRGVGVDMDTMYRAKLISTLALCGELNIHFIWICTGLGKISEPIFSNFNVLVAGRVDSDTSVMLLKSKVAAKTEPANGWMYIKKDGVTNRVKIYQSEITREIAKEEIIL